MGIDVKALHVGHHFGLKRRQVTTLENVSFDLPAGQFGAIVGPSGCGKSTLLRLIADLLPMSQGEIRLGGSAPWHMRQRREISFAFQTPTLLPWKSVWNNVALPSRVGPFAERRFDPDYLKSLLELVGLSDFSDAYPHQLSGGMQQRVAIARALYTRPQLLLMDEPFGALDELIRERLNIELGQILRRSGTTVIMVTHNIQEAVFMADRVWVMSPRPGKIVHTLAVDLPDARRRETLNDPHFLRLVADLRAALYERA